MQMNSMTVSDKYKPRKLMAEAIINHSVGHVSRKNMHLKMQATTKACDTALRKKKEKKISKLKKGRVGGGVEFVGNYNEPYPPPSRLFRDDDGADRDHREDLGI